MNKKKVSVVMAGAMLASSVAPVLAETVETTHGKMGLLIDKLETLMNSKKYHATDVENGKSVYRFSVLDENGKDVTIKDVTPVEYTLSDNKKIKVYSDANVLKKLESTKIYTVKVYELGNIEKNGEFFSKDVVASENVKYEAKDFADLVADVKAFNKAESDKYKAITKYPGLSKAVESGWVTNLELKENDSKVVITLGSKDANGEFNKIECAVGTDKLTFGKPVDAKGNVLAEVKDGKVSYNGVDNDYVQGNIAGFEVAKKEGTKEPVSIAGKNAKLVHEVKVLNGDMNYTVKVDDLYDGFMLTEKGHELMNAVKLFKNDGNNATVQNVKTVESGKGTERFFMVELTEANGTKHLVKVLGDSLHKDKIDTLRKWLFNAKANVELLAGDNRYATAVEIAETYLAGQYDKNGKLDNNELVLINGNALVDGLAAAPYARQQKAPILLTSENNLPKETKDYLIKLINDYKLNELPTITVTIVGGESVVSNSVVKELKDLGLKVKRLSGDNREETSLAVADKITTNKDDKAFVVGANGEADAMSIASYAASKGNPIIVAKSVKGLSTVGLNEVSEYDKVEIIGGEGVVPTETEDALKELVAKNATVTRLNGKNRFETNALVIKNYHKDFTNALIAKDGQRNKTELIDALPASLFASSTGRNASPIVLATDKISDEQLNQLVLNSKADKNNGTVYQIGNGVARSVMEKVVTKLGLNN